MRDQDVISRLAEFHDHIQAPAAVAREDVLRGQRLLRRRRTVSVAAAAAAAAAVVVAVGIAQASLSDDQSELQPAPAPTLPAPSDPGERSPDFDMTFEAFEREVRKIVARVPDWSIANSQRIFTSEPCAGDWSPAGTGWSGGNFDVRTNGELGQVWHDLTGFPSAALASDAVDRLIENLASCKTVAWESRPIAQTGAVLASSADGLIWVQQNGKELSILHAVTTDGPPPLDVQVEIADLMSSNLK